MVPCLLSEVVRDDADECEDDWHARSSSPCHAERALVGGVGSVASEFGHGLLRAVVIDEGFASRGGGDERGNRGVVERCRMSPGRTQWLTLLVGDSPIRIGRGSGLYARQHQCNNPRRWLRIVRR